MKNTHTRTRTGASYLVCVVLKQCWLNQLQHELITFVTLFKGLPISCSPVFNFPLNHVEKNRCRRVQGRLHLTDESSSPPMESDCNAGNSDLNQSVNAVPLVLLDLCIDCVCSRPPSPPPSEQSSVQSGRTAQGPLTPNREVRRTEYRTPFLFNFHSPLFCQPLRPLTTVAAFRTDIYQHKQCALAWTHSSCGVVKCHWLNEGGEEEKTKKKKTFSIQVSAAPFAALQDHFTHSPIT